MKKLLIPLILLFPFLSNAQQPNNSSANHFVYDALNDFSVIDEGNVPYYKDKRNGALGIDARVLEYRNLFAKASRTFEGQPGDYDISLTLLTEEDGEPIYRISVNSTQVGIYRSSHIGADSPRNLKPEVHTWRGIRLVPGDVIGVESVAHTNGEIPENDGTAWARGRWQKLAIEPSIPAKYPRPKFSKHTDLLLAQFDSQPDADDIHSVAALGSMLTHPDMDKVNYVAVLGAVGIQGGKYIDATTLFERAFGRKNLKWTNANQDWEASVNLIKNRVRAVLAQGGKVWVQEAGQSDFTADWVEALIESGIHQSVIKNNVIVVQHSAWNENKTTPTDLTYVQQKTYYQTINDGNKAMREFDRKNRRGALTPVYVDESTKWLYSAVSDENSMQKARQLWQEAVRIIELSGFNSKYSVIPKGGVDFSDIVENWWIFDLDYKAPSVHAFWDRYVTDAPLDKVSPPKGRLAVVIDGNSPDPDDVGATPTMLGILKSTGLTDRLVHISHSCDLDPFRNKGKQQINAENELRRQKILHELTGKSLGFFGPFKNINNYYNCRVDQKGAINDLRNAINASTAEDPLWIIEAGEPDVIGYALEASNPDAHKHVHVVSHHPANDNSGDYFSWQQILDFGITEHQIGDQNVGLKSPIYPWDWAKNHNHPGIAHIWDMLAYAEQDGVVDFQANKFDCSDAGMVYWWITGANEGGNNSATVSDIKDMLLVSSIPK